MLPPPSNEATFAGNAQLYFVIDAGLIVKRALTCLLLICTAAASKALSQTVG